MYILLLLEESVDVLYVLLVDDDVEFGYGPFDFLPAMSVHF
jgi:hypothetical protein